MTNSTSTLVQNCHNLISIIMLQHCPWKYE